jgi:hypothetical protein
MVSWELPLLLADGPSSDPRAKSRRRHHREFLASIEKKPRASKRAAEPVPKADRR